MNKTRLETYAQNTWCKGCGNFGILSAFTQALEELFSQGLRREDVVIASGIGCHAKIVDYVSVNSFYSIHGRVPPTITGVKLANPALTVVGFAGDGDAYGEGLAHLIMSAKRNIDITMVIHDNRVYGLTTGQFTPTSPLGFHGRSTPKGSLEEPLNPIELMLASGATFVARCYSGKIDHLVSVMKKAIKHKGFSFIDVLQPCFTFFNTYKLYNKATYVMEDHDPSDFQSALVRAREWDGGVEGGIPLGVFYQVSKPTFDERILGKRILAGDQSIPDISQIVSRR